MRMLRDERGSVLVMTALSLTLLISFLAFAIDIGNLYYTQRQLQTLADSAAMAGALEISACGSTPNCTVMQTAATSALTESGTATPTLFKQCAAPSGTGLLLTLNNAPCALGSNDPNNGNANYVEAVVTQQVRTYFTGAFGLRTVQVSARAEAGFATAPAGNGPCVNLTGTSGQTLTLNTTTSIVEDAPGSTCGIYDNGNSMSNGVANVASFNVQGSITCNSGCTYGNAKPTKGSTVQDPFASEIAAGTLTAPTSSGMSAGSSTTTGNLTTYTPGYYQNGITFSGSNQLAAGVYYMGQNVILNTGASISGTGVTIYLAGNAGINSNGNASTITLTAPATGPQAGMLIWEAPGDSSAVNLDSGSGSSFGGAIYLPSGELTLNSQSSVTAYGMLVVQQLMVDSNSTVTLSCASMPGGVCPGGSGGGGTSNGSQTISLAE